MENEKDLINESSSVIEDSTPDYLTAIKQLKETTVDRSKYEELRKENKKLIDSIVNGQLVETPQEVIPKESAQELRNKLFSGKDLNNYEYIDTALKLRDAIISDGGIDPFVGSGHKISPTREDFEIAEHVADVMRECLEYSEGDSELFTQELQRRTNDLKLPNRKR